MSRWTHVNGSIRVDSVRALMNLNKGSIAADLGTMVDYEDIETPTIVPCGSEGSLVYSIWENPDVRSTAAFTINIFGDLRDFDEDDCPRILSWINDFTDGKIVRQGIIQIETEDSEPEEIYVYDSEQEAWAKI